ncbi:hypothetical protein [Nocardioides coralli]|uniref:hypothetical protein n=1 Tax=Nocardioides coralli TaxID=2872154 RepID=UPI001CA458B9|nr:hypothetical protein [Nocardioides coralli]QZY29748.1 hypothetical protein K6T13_03375 [Nocardioides coralli]
MTFEPIIRSQSDLHETWSRLMGPLGFSGRSIWLMLIRADHRPLPHLTQIEEADRLPSHEQQRSFAEMLQMLVTDVVPGGRVAFLRSRPGAGGLTLEDKAWARSLYDAARISRVSVEVVHRACDVDLVPVPMDEVLAQPA